METETTIRRVNPSPGAAAAPAALGERLDKVLQVATSDVRAARSPDYAELRESASRINEVMRTYGLEFTVSDTGSRIITRIIDRESGEIIRQIPEEAVLRAAERLDDMVGVLLSDRV